MNVRECARQNQAPEHQVQHPALFESRSQQSLGFHREQGRKLTTKHGPSSPVASTWPALGDWYVSYWANASCGEADAMGWSGSELTSAAHRRAKTCMASSNDRLDGVSPRSDSGASNKRSSATSSAHGPGWWALHGQAFTHVSSELLALRISME